MTEPSDTTAAPVTGTLSPSGPTTQDGVLRTIADAIRGTRHDFTKGSVARAILLLAIPMVLEMAMESLFAIADVFFVAKLGADAVATVGLTESVLTLIYAVAMGLGIGATAMVARRIGEGDAEGASRAAVQAIAVGLVLSSVLGLLGAIMAPRLLVLMGGSPEVVAEGTSYARLMLGGNATILLLFLINAIFRGAGDAAIAMRVLWFANLINIVLDPCLIFGLGPFPEMGVTGAAVATNIGRGCGVLYAFSRLLRRGSRIEILGRLRPDVRVMLRLVRLSAAGTFQAFVGVASWIGLIRILSGFGSEALAGYTIGIRIIIFALLPSWGLSNAAATMVGQALGARDPQRAERAVWRAGFYNMCFLGVVGLVFILFAGPIIRIFTGDPAVMEYAADCLRLVSFGFLFYAYGMVLTASFNGAGDVWTPTVLNLFVFWLWEIPLAYVLAVELDVGPRGVFIAITVAFSTLAVASALVFRRGRWRERTV